MYILARGEYLGYDWLVIGMLKLLVLIATLQLVKKLPDIINGIFGTQLKWQGGVKGRLGEMIGIGGLAQKAWTSLGTGAKNAAKLLAQAPIGAAYLAADKKYFKNKGEHLKNTAAFRQGKGILFGARAGLKSGSLIDAYQGYEQSSALSALTKQDASAVTKNTRASLANNGFSGAVYTGKDANGNFLTKADHQNNMTGILNNAKTSISGYGSDRMQTTLTNYSQQKIINSSLNGIKGKRDEIAESLNSMAAETNSEKFTMEQKQRATSIATRFLNDGKISQEDMDYLVENNIAQVDQMKRLATTIQKYDKGVMDAANGFGIKESDLRGEVGLKTAIGENETSIKSLEDEVKDLMDDNKISESNKRRFSIFQDAVSQVASKYGPTVQNAVKNPDGTDVQMSAEAEWLRYSDSKPMPAGAVSFESQLDDVANRQAQREAAEAAQKQAEAAQRQAEIAQLNTENESISNEMMDSFINDSPAAAQRRDEIRNRKREIEARLKELNNQNNQ